MSNDLQVQESAQLQVQVDVANKYPRKLDTFVDSVFSIVVRDQDFALSCVYCVPVGNDNGIQKFVLGPSVRLSEEMQKFWKHLRVAVNCELEGTKIVMKGLIFDCENNNAETLTSIVETKGWKDRRIELKLKAMQSVIKRDLRLSVIGKSYADELMTKIVENVLGDRVEVWGYCKEKYLEMGVQEQVILNYFKVGKAEELTSKNLYQAIGMYNYLKDNGSEPDFIFGNFGINISSKPKVSAEQVVVEDKPVPAAKASKFTKKPDVKKTEPAKQASKEPEVMGQEDFEKMVFGLLLGSGYDEKSFAGILDVEFNIKGGIKSIPVEMQSEVIDYLTVKSEQAGA